MQTGRTRYHENTNMDMQGLIYKITAASDIGQKGQQKFRYDVSNPYSSVLLQKKYILNI